MDNQPRANTALYAGIRMESLACSGNARVRGEGQKVDKAMHM